MCLFMDLQCFAMREIVLKKKKEIQIKSNSLSYGTLVLYLPSLISLFSAVHPQTRQHGQRSGTQTDTITHSSYQTTHTPTWFLNRI